MPLWRRLAIVGVLGFLVAVTVWAFRPWASAVSLPTTRDNKTPQALFSCGAPLRGEHVDPVNAEARSDRQALPHQPCSTHGARRALAVADLAAGVLALGLLIGAPRHVSNR